MSMFWCARCHGLCDSDDGCEQDPTGMRLICQDCADEMEDAHERRHRINGGGHRDGGSAS